MLITLSQILINGIGIGSLYAMLALAIVLIHMSSGLVNFSQGQMAMVGAYVSFTLISTFKFNFWVAVLFALVFAAFLGLGVERGLVRRMASNSSLLIVGIATLGLYVVVGNVAGMIWGYEPHVYPAPFSTQGVKLAGLVITPISLWIIGIGIILASLLFAFFRFTSMGVAIRATANNSTAAKLMGISPIMVSRFAWGAGSVLGTLCGILFAPVVFMDVYMMESFFIKALTVAVLGGLGSMPGAIVGGLMLGIAENLFGYYVSISFKDVLAFVIIVAVLLYKPTGLFGASRQQRKV